VLVVNAGSSSLKHALVDSERAAVVAGGTERWDPDRPARHGAALRQALADAELGDVQAVGHRVVHGGERFSGPSVIDVGVRQAIEGLVPLAPLHQRAALAGIDAAMQVLPGVPQVACFDTAFHASMPPEATTYALPATWRTRHGFRRYGFHGLNVQWCAEQLAVRRLVVCHLGSGCSVTAVLDGRSIDTTMGWTPLEGVVMATRSGSIDPTIVLEMVRSAARVDDVDDVLNHRSGLLGLSRVSGDLRRILEAVELGDADARLAIDVFVRSITGAIGAMATALGGVDAIAFSGGVGEHATSVRDAIVRRVAFLDAEVRVIAAGEEQVIARQTGALLN